MQSNLSNLSIALYTLQSNPYAPAKTAIETIGYLNGSVDSVNKLPHFYDFDTAAETDYKNALIAIGNWATSFTVSFDIDGTDTNINLTHINNFQTYMHEHHSNSSTIKTSYPSISPVTTPFNNYNYDSTDSATMNTQISRIQSLFTSLSTAGSYPSYQMLVESSSSHLHNYLSNNATSRTHSSTDGTIGNIYIKFDFFNSTADIPSSTYHAYYTYDSTTVTNYRQLTDSSLSNPFEISNAAKNAPSLLTQLDDVYKQMEMIEKVAKWARLSQTVQVMQKICSTNNPPVPTDFTASSSLPTETSKYILSVFDLPATSLKPPIKDFDLRLEFSNDISFYPLSNLFETPMNTFSDLYSVKSNDCLFMSWTNDRKLFPICSNEYKSPLYSNMLLNIPFTKNIAGTILSINTGLKINDRAVATKSVTVSNLNLMSTNNELTAYLDELRMESGFVDTNMSNTQQFQFKADVNFMTNGRSTDIYEPISNITPDSFKFPYYKCYTIPTNDVTSADLAKGDLEIMFRGNDEIVFNSNSDMFWYNADLYKSLLVLTETDNNLSFTARGSTVFTKNEKSNIFYVAGIPQGGGTIKSVFDVESCIQRSYLHMEQTLVTMCNLTSFRSNHSRVPPWTAHDVFLYMSREGFSNIIFNNSFDLNTDLYQDPTTEGNLQNYQIMPFGAADNSSNLYMWYSNSAGNNLNLSFELSNSGSKTYNNYDGCKFYDMSSPKVNHIAIATNDTNKVRVNMNVDHDTTPDLSNVFLHLNYPNTEYFNNDQYIYVFENRNHSIYVNIDSNISDGNSKIASLYEYGIVDPIPIRQHFDFYADVNFKKTDGSPTDIYEPISNIRPDSFKFPYYKCYTSADLAKGDLEIMFSGNNEIVFNSNSDMFWYNADLYKSLLVLTETDNNLSFTARGSTVFTKNEKSNIFYVAGIPQGGGTIKSVFDVESCIQRSYLHMEQTLVTMCNLTSFRSNHSRVPPWTAHDVFLYMSREGFSNIIFNNSFDLNTDLYQDPTTEGNLQNYQIMPFGAADNSSNLYMWYSNSAGNNLNLSFELSNSGSKTYNNYDGCKFYDMSSPKVNHIAIATNDTNKVRVNMNVDHDTTPDLSNVFLHLNYPNTEYFNNDQYIYVFENRNHSIYVNIDSNISDGNSKIASLNEYGIVDLIPITLNFDSVYRLTEAASTPFEYTPSFNQTDTIDLNYTHTSKIFRAYGFKISIPSSKFFEIQFELTNTRPGRNLKLSTKPVRNYQNYHQVDQRVEVQETNDILFTRFYRPDSSIGDLYFSICIETTMIPIEKNYLRMGTLTYKYANSSTASMKEFLESDTFPYATDLY